MKATLKLEIIGGNRPSVALIRPGAPVAAPFGRAYLKGKRDYAKANSVGSRGVYEWFILESGCVYAVTAQVSWKATRLYFVQATERGEVLEISEEIAEEIVNKIPPAPRADDARLAAKAAVEMELSWVSES